MKRFAAIAAAAALLCGAAGMAAAKEIKVGFIATNFSAESQARVANAFEKIAKDKKWDVKMLTPRAPSKRSRTSSRTCSR